MTNKFRQKQADLITHPPIDKEKDETLKDKDKKKKKLYQLNMDVEDVTMNDIT